MAICESCELDKEEKLRQYDGEMQCSNCIREAIEHEEGQLFVRDELES